MAKSSDSSGEEVVQHYGLIRFRIVGSGNLKMALYSLDTIKQNNIADLAMVPNTNIQPTKLCNFTQQRAQLEIRTTAINEFFIISQITIFIKPVAASFPQ